MISEGEMMRGLVHEDALWLSSNPDPSLTERPSLSGLGTGSAILV